MENLIDFIFVSRIRFFLYQEFDFVISKIRFFLYQEIMFK